MKVGKLSHLATAMLCMLPVLSHAETDTKSQNSPQFDLENALDINELCAGCHGNKGQGGKGGIYPRLAGLSAQYMTRQINDFKSRKRINLPMLPYANDRELSGNDVHDITTYLSQIQLDSKLPEQSELMDGLERLQQTKSIVQIGRHEGDINRGERIYMEACKVCHSRDGLGRSDKPQLRGQHTTYLIKQMRDFRDGTRKHVDWEVVFAQLSETDMNNILAFLSILDD